MKNKKYWYWLCNIEKIGNKTIEALLKVYKTPEEIYSAKEKDLKKIGAMNQKMIEYFLDSRNKDWERGYERMRQKGISFVVSEEEEYPERLKKIVDKPYGLYYIGKLPKEEISVAIIGARNCSRYGFEVAKNLGKLLGEHQVQVVSGMARGIDGAGQWGALEGGGKSYAVLGSGVDICYPAENRKLYELLKEKGGVISEFPMGAQPMSYHFPMRNRIISGLSDVVVVVEARKKSGTYITVDMALEQGKEVYAVPGRITDSLSDGCNELIKTGANVLTKIEDLLTEIGITKKNFKNLKKLLLAEKENMLYSNLDLQPKNIQVLAEETKMELPQVIEVLLQLQLKGLIQEPVKNYYCLSGDRIMMEK